MFTWLNASDVQSDKGYVIQTAYMDREWITTEYREDGRIAAIEGGHTRLPGNKYAIEVCLPCFSTWSSGEAIPVARQKEMLNNFLDVQAFKGTVVLLGEKGKRGVYVFAPTVQETAELVAAMRKEGLSVSYGPIEPYVRAA